MDIFTCRAKLTKIPVAHVQFGFKIQQLEIGYGIKNRRGLLACDMIVAREGNGIPWWPLAIPISQNKCPLPPLWHSEVRRI